jgi:hypothetical protein
MAVAAGVACTVITGTALAACSGNSGSSSVAPYRPGYSALHSAALGAPTPAGSAKGAAARSGAGASLVTAGSAGVSVTVATELIIRTGAVTLQVPHKSVVNVFDSATRDAALLEGYVASSTTTGAGDAAGASLTLRVPSNSFATLVGEIDKLGKVESQQIGGRDVTGQSVDLNARITNLQSEETALRTLITQSGSIPNLLQVQDQLFGVEGEIEQLTAQENSLLDHASFATLVVDLTPKAAPIAAPPPKQGSIVRAWHLAGHNTVVALRAVAIAAGWAFPIVIVAAAAGALWLWRRRRSRSAPPAPLSA